MTDSEQIDTERLQKLIESIYEVRQWTVACKAKQDQLTWEARQEDDTVHAARCGGRHETYYTVEEVLVESVIPHIEKLAESHPDLSIPETGGSDGGNRDV